jgi:ATP-dependent RNA helicase DeaD
MVNFTELGIKPEFIKALDELNIKIPTEIQEKTIPFLLAENADFIGQAQTGTGKTAAYGLPLLQKINTKNKKIQALILAPTRELGIQIKNQLFKFTKYSDKIFVEAVYGGAPIEKQIVALKRETHIIVATPGRLIDLLNKNVLDLKNVNTIILDEADEMLSMGFKNDINTILDFTTGQRVTWLFSATMPNDIKLLIKNYLAEDSKYVKIDKDFVINKNIEHQYLICHEDEKFHVLYSFLGSQGKNRGVVFCKTKNAAKQLEIQLTTQKIKAVAIHGDLLQKERDKVMRAFKNESIQFLIATDIAARGMDFKGISFVVHYQLPENLDYFTHRSGRTARAGQKGISLIFIQREELNQIKYYESNLKIKITKLRY